MDRICFHVVVSSNEAASRLLANSLLLCDIKGSHWRGEREGAGRGIAGRQRRGRSADRLKGPLIVISTLCPKGESRETWRAGANLLLIAKRSVSTSTRSGVAARLIRGRWSLAFCCTRATCHRRREEHIPARERRGEFRAILISTEIFHK